jgi:hypothetical protein
MVALTLFAMGGSEETPPPNSDGLIEENEDAFRGDSVKQLYIQYRRGACRQPPFFSRRTEWPVEQLMNKPLSERDPKDGEMTLAEQDQDIGAVDPMPAWKNDD